MGIAEEIDKTIEDLEKRYPENLTNSYKCYWHWYTELSDNSKPMYQVMLEDKNASTNTTCNYCLRAFSEDPEKLVELLEHYLKVCK